MTVVRPYQPGDAEAVCQLWNRFGFGATENGRELSPDQVEQWRDEAAIVALFVAERYGRVVATVGCARAVEQFAARDGALYVTALFLHPELSSGTIAAQLMQAAVLYCLRNGWRSLDAVVASTNRAAIRLLRRAGGQQVGEASPVRSSEEPSAHIGGPWRDVAAHDGLVEIRNFVPVVLRFLFGLAARSNIDYRAATRGGLMRSLPPVRRSSRPSDTHRWNGTDVAAYDVEIQRGFSVRCLVDLAVEQVTSIAGLFGTLDLRPTLPRRVVSPGESVEMGLYCRNDLPYPSAVSVTDRSGAAVGEAVVAAGSSCIVRWQHLPSVREGVEPVAVRVHLDPEIGKAWRIDLCASLRTAASRPAPLYRPRPERPAAALDRTGNQWRLENRWVRISLDGDTGTLEMAERSTLRLMVRELWPEFGPPFPGTIRRPARRDITLVSVEEVDGEATLVVESVANAWVDRAPDDEVLRVRRRLRLRGDQLLEVSTEVVARPGDEQPAGRLRTFGWAAGRSLQLAVPLGGQIFRAPVLPPDGRAGGPGPDASTPPDLPTDPARLDDPWAAWTGPDGIGAGFLFPGAAEVRFGRQWLPSVLYDLPPGPGPVWTLPTYYLWCGRGGDQAVDAAWRAVADHAPERHRAQADDLPGAWPGSTDVPVFLRLDLPDGSPAIGGVLEPLGSGPRTGHLMASSGRVAAPVQLMRLPGEGRRFSAGFDDLAPGVHAVEVRWEEADAGCHWRVPIVVCTTTQPVDVAGTAIDNGVVHAVVDRALRALDASGQRWIAGDNGFALCCDQRGWSDRLDPHVLPCDSPRRADIGVGDAVWTGIEAATVGRQLKLVQRYLTAPGLPLVYATARFQNACRRTRRFEVAFVLAVPDAEPAAAGTRPPNVAAATRGHSQLALVSSGGEVMSRPDGADVSLVALDQVVLAPGENRLLVICLVVTDSAVPLASLAGLGEAGKALHQTDGRLPTDFPRAGRATSPSRIRR